MAALAFDTLKFSNRLKAAGIPSAHAEAEAEALADALDVNLRELSTKDDLKALREELKFDITLMRKDLQQTETVLNHEFNSKIDLLRAELKKDLAENKADLVRWVVAVGLLQSTLIVGVLMKIAKLI